MRRKSLIQLTTMITLVLSGCRDGMGSGVTGADNFTSSVLEATDIAILYPLKAETTSDSVFGIEGTGVCNAPRLSGSAGTLVSRQIFTEFVERNFGQRCPDRAVSFDADEEILRDPESHLARLKGLDSGICDYENWVVVGFRLDPCLDTNPRGFCAEREARLIAQPVIERGGLRILDNAMHLIYRIPNPEAIIKDLEQVAAVRKQIVAQHPWQGVDTSNPRLLIPHPGLRAEMGSCGGRMATAIDSFFQKNTQSDNLVQIAWMTSSTGATEWTFATENLQNGQFRDGPNRPHTNFSKSLFKEGRFPFNDALNPTHSGRAPGNISDLFVPGVMLGAGSGRTLS